MSVHPILSARQDKGLSQDALAKLVGVSKASVCKWEQGKAYPEPRTAFRVAKALRVRLEDVYASARAAA